MKLALLAAEFLPNWGGAGTYNVRLVKQLMNEIDIHVITPERKVPNSNVTYSKEKILDIFDNKINLHIISEAKDTFLYNAKFQYSIYKELPKLHKKYEFDIMHTDHPHMSDILYRFRQKIPSVTTVHTLIEDHLQSIESSNTSFYEKESSEKFQILLKKPLLFTENIYLKSCRNMITVSDWMKSKLLTTYKNTNIDVVYSGVETDIFSKAQNSSQILENIDKQIVLFSSRMTSAKGGHFLIKAMAKIIKATKDVHFIFAGSDLEQPWKSLIESNNIDSKYYTFLGYLPYEMLPILYSRATIYTSPSLQENLPARILEAMSCEKPVVATNICAIPEAISNGYNGLLVPPRDENALAEAILTLLNDENYSRTLGVNARKTVVEKFDWRKLALQIKSIYEKIVEMK